MKETFIWIVIVGGFIVGCGNESKSPQAPSNSLTSPSARPNGIKKQNEVRQPNPWDNPAEFSAWVDNRNRAIHGIPPARQNPTRVEDAFKAVFVEDKVRLDRVHIVLNIALKQAEAGERTEAIKNVSEILKRLNEFGSYEFSAGGKEAVYALVVMGEYDLAREIAEKIVVQYWKRPALLFIARALVEEGKKDEAIVVLKDAVKVAQSINDKNGGSNWEYKKVSALLLLAEKLAEAGDKDAALTVLNEAKVIIPSIEGAKAANFLMGSIWGAIAEAQFALGNKEDALASLKKAVEVVHTIEHPEPKSVRYIYPAKTYAEIGESELASNTFKQATATAGNIEDPSGRARRLFGISVSLAKTGAFKEALNVAGTIEDVDGHNPPAAHRYDAYLQIADELKSKQVPKKFRIDRNGRAAPILRLKKAFTPEEQAFAREVVEALKGE